MKRKKVMKSIGESMIALGIKVAEHEELLQRHNISLESHRQRLSDHDEEIEALDEVANPSKTCVECPMVHKVESVEQANQFLFPIRGEVEMHARQITGLFDDRTALFKAKQELEGRVNALELVIGEFRRTNDVAREVSNRQAKLIMSLTNENLKLRDQVKGLNERVVTIYDRLLMFEEIYKTHNHAAQKKTYLVMEKNRPVGRPRKDQ